MGRRLIWAATSLAVLLAACGGGAGDAESVPLVGGSFDVAAVSQGDCEAEYRSALAAHDPETGALVWSVQTPWTPGSTLQGFEDAFVVATRDGVVSLSRDGMARWHTRTPRDVATARVVGDGVVVVTVGPVLRSFDARNGAERWAVDFGGDRATPPTAVDDDMVVIGTEKRLVAIDLGSGEEIWRVQGDASAGSAPIVGDGVVYAVVDGQFVAVATESGEFVRTTPASEGRRALRVIGVDAGIAVIEEDAVEESEDGPTPRPLLVGVDITSGEARWTIETTRAITNRATLIPGLVVASSARTGTIGYDVGTGEERWTVRSLNIAGQVALAVDETALYFIGAPGAEPVRRLAAVDLATGELLWEEPLPGQRFPAPALSEGVLLIGGTAPDPDGIADVETAGFLSARDPATGEELWSVQTAEPVPAAPVLLGDLLYVITADWPLPCE